MFLRVENLGLEPKLGGFIIAVAAAFDLFGTAVGRVADEFATGLGTVSGPLALPVAIGGLADRFTDAFGDLFNI